MKTRYTISIFAMAVVAIIIGAILIQSAQSPAFRLGYPRVSQNDMLCSTSWVVHHDAPIDPKTIETFLRMEISALGQEYGIPDRKITIQQIDADSIKITIQGSWHHSPTEPNEPDLTKSIAKIEGIKEIDEELIIACA